jgi:hypothetical protein
MAAPALKILTANHLRSGEVLYWKFGGWVESLAEAEIFTDEAAAEAALAQAQISVTANRVVTPYLFEVRQNNGAIHPIKEREIIRSLGPSIRPDTGKQSVPELNNV